VAHRGVLFTRDSLEAEQEFRGIFTVEDPALRYILAGLGPVRIGGSRTTHGLATVTLSKNAGQPPAAQGREDGELILRLQSAGTFTYDCGRPNCEPRPPRNSGEGSASRRGWSSAGPAGSRPAGGISRAGCPRRRNWPLRTPRLTSFLRNVRCQPALPWDRRHAGDLPVLPLSDAECVVGWLTGR
jgi:hypothetical protein